MKPINVLVQKKQNDRHFNFVALSFMHNNVSSALLGWNMNIDSPHRWTYQVVNTERDERYAEHIFKKNLHLLNRSTGRKENHKARSITEVKYSTC